MLDAAAMQGERALTARQQHQLVDPLREAKAHAAAGIANAQQQQAPGRQRGPYPLQHLGLRLRGQVVQHIQDDHGIGAAEWRTADVGLQHLTVRPERAARPRDLARHELYPAHRLGARRRRPGRRPVAALVTVRGGSQPRSQESLAAAQVEDARSCGQQAELQDRAEYRISA